MVQGFPIAQLTPAAIVPAQADLVRAQDEAELITAALRLGCEAGRAAVEMYERAEDKQLFLLGCGLLIGGAIMIAHA